MAQTNPIKRTEAEQALIDQFDAGALSGDSTSIADARQAAFGRVRERGLPHRRIEEYKYTDLRALMRTVPPIAGPVDPDWLSNASIKAAEPLADLNCLTVTIANGALSRAPDATDLPAGVAIAALADILASGAPLPDTMQSVEDFNSDSIVDLNTAFMSDGAVLSIDDGTDVEQPILLQHLADDNTSARYARHRITIGAGARVTLIEQHQGPDGVEYQGNTTIELTIGDNAVVDLIRIQDDGDKALHLSTIGTHIGEGATLRQFTLTTGAAVSRAQTFCHMAGPKADATLAGVTLIGGKQHADTTVTMDHAVPDCQSREQFKTVVDGQARAVFQGRISVRQHAQGSDGRMMLNGLLLTEEAECISKPELEIFADDVQCAHGSTTGEIDDNLLFYLRTRGIPEDEARTMLITAFIGEVIEEIVEEKLRDIIMALSESWLRGRK